MPNSVLSLPRSIKIALLITLLLFISLPLTLLSIRQQKDTRSKAAPGKSSTNTPIREKEGDLWADVVVGKRDFGENAPGKIDPTHVFMPGGVLLDRSTTPGRLYVWDAGNNRILGFDLSLCDITNTQCNPQIIIGQPSGTDFGGCNQDGSMSSWPDRKIAGKNTLCGQSDNTFTTLEDASRVNMAVDNSGNLYVPDARNNRVLKYNSPFTTDTIADEVWGQDDFTGVYCNKQQVFYPDGTPDFYNAIHTDPKADSFCYQNDERVAGFGMGVTLDPTGNLWVADSGNNRVLRFPQSEGVIAKSANLAVGQNILTENNGGNGLNQLYNPYSVVFRTADEMYVTDVGNNRVMKYTFTPTGRIDEVFWQPPDESPLWLKIDPLGRGLWVSTSAPEWKSNVILFSWDKTQLAKFTLNGSTVSGGFDITSDGQIIFSNGTGHIVAIAKPESEEVKILLSGPNTEDQSRFMAPAWGGVVVTNSQLIAGARHLYVWNNPNSLTNGQAPDVVLSTMPLGFNQMTKDSNNRIYIAQNNDSDEVGRIVIYDSPITADSIPIKTITLPLPLAGGGTVQFANHGFTSVSVTPDGKFLWAAEPRNNRVLRIRNPLTQPVVDVLIGQKDANSTLCNQGSGLPAEQASLQMLCSPGSVNIDKKGNIYISDHFIESEGNWRLLMYQEGQFPDTPPETIFNPIAVKEFPIRSNSNPFSHEQFQMSFNSQNNMVIGNNPYSGIRFVHYYQKPDQLNPSNPRDPEFAKPDGKLIDFYGWPISTTFDEADNLYVYDANRGQVRKYLNPFAISLTPSSTPSNTPSPVLSPTPTLISPTPTREPTPTPIPPISFTFLNTSFESDSNGLPNNWEKINIESEDKTVTKVSHQPSTKSFQMVYKKGRAKVLRQVISKQFIPKGSTFTLSGWNKLDQTIKSGVVKLVVVALHTDGTKITYPIYFNTKIHDWQYKRQSFKLIKDTNYLSIRIKFSGKSGTTYFDDLDFVSPAITTPTGLPESPSPDD